MSAYTRRVNDPKDDDADTRPAPSIGEDETLAGESGPSDASAHDDELVGRVLGGRYRIVEFLGAGGMGAVYRARDRELDEWVAIKWVPPELATRTELIDRLRSEVRLARRVGHPGVARVYELHDLDERRFVTMEYVEGETLSALSKRQPNLPPDVWARVGARVARALEAAHAAGVVHRDIKPDNVMMRSDGSTVILDFGIALPRDTAAGGVSGTPAYMAPEQVRGEAPTPAVDLYALGVTLFQLITGTLPFTGASSAQVMLARLSQPPPDARSLRPDLSATLADALQRAMATHPADRFADARAFAGALEAVTNAQPDAGTTVAVRTRTKGEDPALTLAVPPWWSAGNAPEHLFVSLREEVLLGMARLPELHITIAPEVGAADFAIEARSVPSRGMVTATVQDRRSSEAFLRGNFPLRADQVNRIADLLVDAVALAAGLEHTGVWKLPPLPPAAMGLLASARSVFQSLSTSDYRPAIGLYEQALSLAPDHPVLVAGHAMASLRAAFFSSQADTDFDAIRHSVTRSLAAAPHRPEPHLAAGHIALHLDDPLVAARRFRTAVRVAPLWSDGHVWLGRMLLEAGFLEDGRARIEAALTRNPELSSLRWELARAAGLAGDWDEAQRQLDLLSPKSDAT